MNQQLLQLPRLKLSIPLSHPYSTVDLVNALKHEKAKGFPGRIAISLMRMDLVIPDELRYLSFSQAGGILLFRLLLKLYQHTSVLIASNVLDIIGKLINPFIV